MQTETLQHRWAIGFRREFPCTKSHFLLHSHVLGRCQVTHKEVSGLSASIQPWMETYILTATPGFTKAQPFLVEASHPVGHRWTSACRIRYIQRQTPGSGSPAQLAISVAWLGRARGQLQPRTQSRQKQTWLFWDVRQPCPSSHLVS